MMFDVMMFDGTDLTQIWHLNLKMQLHSIGKRKGERSLLQPDAALCFVMHSVNMKRS